MLHTIGLLEIRDYLDGKIDYQRMYELSVKNTRNYAKRQFTWFRNQFRDVDLRVDCVVSGGNVGMITDGVYGIV